MPPARRKTENSSSKVTTKQQVYFDKERETKNAVRFAEAPEEGQEPLIGTLYVKKTLSAKLGNPESLVVTVEADDS